MKTRLTKKEKAIRKRQYKLIRKQYEQLKRENRLPDVYGGGKLSYVQFKNRVKLRQRSEEISLPEAVRKEANTETFVAPAERSRVNFIQGLKDKFKEDYRELLKKSKNAKGQFVSMKENLVWDSDRGGYVLAGKWFIDVTNSPEEVIITEI